MRKVIVGAMSMTVAFAMAAGAADFPKVEPVEKGFVVNEVENADVRLTINTVAGMPAYLLQCHSASYSLDRDFAYSGDFECRLSSALGTDEYSTLLTEDEHQSRDWESRGRFFVRSITGECANVPEFGATRTFRLRLMLITLQVEHVVLTNARALRGLTLRVSVKQDLDAAREIAESVAFPMNAPSECDLGRYFVRPMRVGA